MQYNVAAVIPVYNPEPGLEMLCRELLVRFGMVVVIDDGSTENLIAFDSLPKSVLVLRHNENKGKGRAIKTSFEWLLANAPGIDVVVFADGDGQHRPCDVENVAKRASATASFVFGVRDFKKSGIPFRSRFGNVLTSWLVRRIFRVDIYDTQTGLRAVPRRLWSEMIALPGERYEYEMRAFGLLKRIGERAVLVPIETVYVENNRTSHFRPIVDSFRIYRGLFGDIKARGR